MSNVDEKIKELAKLAASSNRITEIHEKNMKMYPFVFFDGIQDVKIEYDLEVKHNVDETNKDKLIIRSPIRNNFVKYYLTIGEDVLNEHLDRRYIALEASIRTLFWKDVIVHIYINENLVFESKNNGRKEISATPNNKR